MGRRRKLAHTIVAALAGALCGSSNVFGQEPIGSFVNVSTGDKIEFRSNGDVFLSQSGEASVGRCIDAGANWCISGQGFDCSYRIRFVGDRSAFTLQTYKRSSREKLSNRLL